MASPIYQIHVELQDIQPKIWRRLLVPSDILLVDFHRILQTAMGWTNSHLHLFDVGIVCYSPEDFEIEDTIDSRKVRLKQIFDKESEKMLYEYDLGDGWKHEITLERIIKKGDHGQIPRCLEGAGNCPPEDCGGRFGYAQLLQTIADPDHFDHEDMMIWLGGSFDPAFFDLNQINQQLSEPDYGCIWLE